MECKSNIQNLLIFLGSEYKLIVSYSCSVEAEDSFVLVSSWENDSWRRVQDVEVNLKVVFDKISASNVLHLALFNCLERLFSLLRLKLEHSHVFGNKVCHILIPLVHQVPVLLLHFLFCFLVEIFWIEEVPIQVFFILQVLLVCLLLHVLHCLIIVKVHIEIVLLKDFIRVVSVNILILAFFISIFEL